MLQRNVSATKQITKRVYNEDKDEAINTRKESGRILHTSVEVCSPWARLLYQNTLLFLSGL